MRPGRALAAAARTLIEQPELAPALREELSLAQRQAANLRTLRVAK